MSKNKLQEKRLKAMEKYIKKSIRHSHKNITEYSYEYGVIGGKYLCDAYDIVFTNDDISSLPQSKCDMTRGIEQMLKSEKNAIKDNKTYIIDINKLINDIKADGYKDTLKQMNYEKQNSNETYVVYINNTFIYFRLFYKAYMCIDNNEVCKVSDIGNKKQPIYISNDVGEILILPFNTDGKKEVLNSFKCYNLLDYVVK